MRHELIIEGMGCDHCVRSIEQALAGIEGVTKVEVELGKAVVETRAGLDLLAALRQAVASEGYAVARAA
jgi:copper chaperone CopZ